METVIFGPSRTKNLAKNAHLLYVNPAPVSFLTGIGSALTVFQKFKEGCFDIS
jgi:hypothetical protein